MNRITFATVAALATVAVAGPAAAQSRPTLGLAVGANVPTSTLDNSQNAGFHGAVSINLRPVNSAVGFRGEGAFHQFSGEDNASDFRSASFTGNILLEIPGSAVKPYVIGGAGLYNTKFGSGDARNNVGVNGGVGLRFDMGDFATYAELRIHNVFNGINDDNSAQFVPISFGILF